MAEQVTGIVGNTRSQQESATTSREEQKQANWSLGFKIGIGATLLAVAVALSTAELNLFWKLVTGVIFIKMGSILIEQKKKSDLLWVWPQILKYAGVATILIALFNSGIGAWTESIVKSVDTAASCSADPTQKVCAEKAEKEAADKAAIEEQRLAAMVRQQPVVQAPQISYPVEGSCGEPYASFAGCKKITLKGDATYQRTALNRQCIAFSPEVLVRQEHIGGSTYSYSAARGGEVVIHFFDLPVGETYDGFTCK